MPQPATKPAKAKPKRGPGKPKRQIPRLRNLPRVSEATHARLTAYAARHDLYLADAIEHAAQLLPISESVNH
jgi:hypothetical protein